MSEKFKNNIGKAQLQDRPRLRAAFAQAERLNDQGHLDHDSRQRAVELKEAMNMAQARPSQRTKRAGIHNGRAVPPSKVAKGTTAGLHHDNSGWISLGPHNVGGRTLAILGVKQNGQIILYAGAASGGVWRSDDDGSHWVPTEDLMPNLAVSALVADPKDNTGQTLFAGTGEGALYFSDSEPDGAGVYKSTDGWSWTQVAETQVSSSNPKFGTKFGFINRLAFTADGKTLVAATNNGLFYSTDQVHETWTQATMKTGGGLFSTRLASLAAHPTNKDILVAGAQSGGSAYLSRDGGKTWEPLTKPAGSAGVGRTEICFGRAKLNATDADVSLFAAVEVGDANANGEIWRWVNDSSSVQMSLVSTVNGLFKSAGNQGWYDNTIWAGDLQDPQLIVVGGVNVFRSIDGGATFTKIGGYSTLVHPDQHFLIEDPRYGQTETLTLVEKDATGKPVLDANRKPKTFSNQITNKRLYVGNDGGMYTTYNIKTVVPGTAVPKNQVEFTALGGAAWWQDINHGYSVTQFYYGAGNPKNRVVIAGAQDNGSHGHTPGNYDWDTSPVSGGDGGQVAYDANDNTRYYAEYVNLMVKRVTRTTTVDPTTKKVTATWGGTDIYGERWVWDSSSSEWIDQWFANGYYIPDVKNKKTEFIAPFELDVKDSKVMYAGGASLWRTMDATVPISPDPRTDPTGSVAWHEFLSAPAGAGNSTTIAVASSGTQTSGGAYTDAVADIILVGYAAGKIFRTKNGNIAAGQVNLANNLPQWEEITPLLAGTTRRCLRVAVDPKNTDTYYAGYAGYQAGGLFKTTDGGTSWQDISTGRLPSVPIKAITVHPQNSNWVYIGTDIGLFTSEDGGVSWSVNNEGPASVTVSDLLWMGNTLVVVTYGRGVFQIDIPFNAEADALLIGDDMGKLTSVSGAGVTDNERQISTGNIGAILVVPENKSLADSLGETVANRVKDTAFVGDNQGALHWIDAKTLQDKWATPQQIGGAITARPELWQEPENDHLYVLASGNNGHLQGFDLSDRDKKVIDVNVLTLANGETADIYSNEVMGGWAYLTSPKGLFAVRLVGDNPEVEWKHTKVHSVAAILLASNKAFVSSTDGTVSAYHARTGTIVWSHQAGSNPSKPVWAMGAVVVGTMGGEVVGYDYETGTELFRHAVGGAVQALTADDNMLYFVSGKEGGTLMKLELLPGRPGASWQVNEVGMAKSEPGHPPLIGTAQPPVVVGTKLFINTVTGELACYQTEPATGSSTLPPAWGNLVQLSRPSSSGLSVMYAAPAAVDVHPAVSGQLPTADELDELHPHQSGVDHLYAGFERTMAMSAQTPPGAGVSIAMALDVSGSMTHNNGEGINALRTAGASFVYIMRGGQDSLGIATFSTQAHYLWGANNKVQFLTDINTQNSASQAITGLQTDWKTYMHEGLEYAQNMLSNASGVRAVVFMSDGLNEPPEGAAYPDPLPIANSLNSQGINVYTVAMGSGADTSMLRQIAGADERFHVAASWLELDKLFKDILSQVNIAQTVINEVKEIPAYKAYQQAAATPPGAKTILLAATWPDHNLKWVDKPVPTESNELVLYLQDAAGTSVPTSQLSLVTSGPGFAVFKLNNPASPIYQGTAWAKPAGGNLSSVTISIGILADSAPGQLTIVRNGSIVRAGRPLEYGIMMHREGKPLEIVNAQIEMAQPTVSPEAAMAVHRPQLNAIREAAAAQGNQITDNIAMMALASDLTDGGPHRYQSTPVEPEQDGPIHLVQVPTDQAGIHKLSVVVTAFDPETGQLFTLTRHATAHVY